MSNTVSEKIHVEHPGREVPRSVQGKGAILALMNTWQTERRIVEAIAALSQVGPLDGRAASLHNSVKSGLTAALANARELMEEL